MWLDLTQLILSLSQGQSFDLQEFKVITSCLNNDNGIIVIILLFSVSRNYASHTCFHLIGLYSSEVEILTCVLSMRSLGLSKFMGLVTGGPDGTGGIHTMTAKDRSLVPASPQCH